MTITKGCQLMFNDGSVDKVKLVNIKERQVTTEKNLLYSFKEIVAIVAKDGEGVLTDKEVGHLRREIKSRMSA